MKACNTKHKNKHIVKKLKGALHEEKEAIKEYRKDAQKVDTKTAKIFRSIAKDETEHKQRLTKRLSKIK